MLGHYSHQSVELDADCSRWTISKHFRIFFTHPPTPQLLWEVFPPQLETKWVYGLDGTYLHRHGVLLLHKSVLDNQTLWWSWAKSESYESINHDLAKLLPYLSHHCPVGAISDWKGSMVGSIKAHFGSLPH